MNKGSGGVITKLIPSNLCLQRTAIVINALILLARSTLGPTGRYACVYSFINWLVKLYICTPFYFLGTSSFISIQQVYIFQSLLLLAKYFLSYQYSIMLLGCYFKLCFSTGTQLATVAGPFCSCSLGPIPRCFRVLYNRLLSLSLLLMSQTYQTIFPALYLKLSNFCISPGISCLCTVLSKLPFREPWRSLTLSTS